VWFGGGADLTPYYLFREDAVHFHKTFAAACDRHRPVGDYDRFKKWCDDYFFLPHRGETRGIGGIFFDYLGANGEHPIESVFDLVRDLGHAFLAAYTPIVQRRVQEPWSELERTWQLLRRGRYVEFNLLYDRGTLFGLKTNGRVESILMSLPPLVRWDYDVMPTPGSREAELVAHLRPTNWIER
jgi:coproporphyrinogen III oxidase